jgi:hypothetical protein
VTFFGPVAGIVALGSCGCVVVGEPPASGGVGHSPVTLCVANGDTTSSAQIKTMRPAVVPVKLSAAHLVLTQNPLSLNCVRAVGSLENAMGTYIQPEAGL